MIQSVQRALDILSCFSISRPALGINEISDAIGLPRPTVHGLVRTLIANMVKGVSNGFEKSLEIAGVGYRAEVAGKNLKLIVGFSAPIEYAIPDGIQIKVDRLVNIAISGIDKQMVGRVAAEIRSLKKPEPYKGKGIKYTGEQIRRKVGKYVGAE